MIFMEKKFYIREASSGEGKNADWSGAVCVRFPNLKRTPVKIAQASRLRSERIGASTKKTLLPSLSAFAGGTPALL
jgi:hypothetical protein